MRIGLTIGRLDRGGSERQLMALAKGLAARGHEVEVLCYGGPSPYDAELVASGVGVRTPEAAGRTGKVRAAAEWMGTFRPDVVHGFMKRASLVAALARARAKGMERRPAVVANDYSTATFRRTAPALWASLLGFSLADSVTTETELNRRSLEKLAPWLRGKTVVIRNGIDTERYRPAPEASGGSEARAEPERGGALAVGDAPEAPFRFCAVSRVVALKNPVRVVRAAAELDRREGVGPFVIDWYGRYAEPGEAPYAAYAEAKEEAERSGVAHLVRFHGDTSDVERVYREADALLHASVQEGFPNAVAEGLASGLPVAVSDVSDLPLVVQEARNGVVFDESDPRSIADALARLMATPEAERRAMGGRSRDLAVRWFAESQFIDAHERLYESVRVR